MYSLVVFYPGERLPAETVRLDRGSEALAAIPDMLKKHKGCERVEVMVDATHLFSVDCEGQRLD